MFSAGKIVRNVENLSIPLWGFAVMVALFGSIRYYLEIAFFHYENVTFVIFLHSISYYIMLYFFVLACLKIITNENVYKIISALTISTPIIILPPILDKFVFGRTIGYSYPTLQNWANIALTFFESNPEYMYRGHQIEFALILLLIFVYIYTKLNKMKKAQRIAISSASTFSIYITIFFLSTPQLSIIYNLLYVPGPYSNFTRDYPYIVYNFRYILVAFLSFWTAILVENPKKVAKLLKDASPPRILHFSLMFILGFFLQYSALGISQEIYIRGNLLMLLIGTFSAASGWAFVVGINNYYDKLADEITNNYRGLTTGEYSETNLMGFIILTLAAGGYAALLIGVMPFLFYTLFILMGFLYSYPKIYLKKYGIKTIIIGLGSALLLGMGYFSPWFPQISGMNERFWIYFIVIFTVFSAGSVMNDLKDYESDKEGGTRTIFTHFGREKGKKVGALLLIIAFSVPSILAPLLTPAFITLAVLAAYLLLKEKVLYIYFVYFSEYFMILFFHTL